MKTPFRPADGVRLWRRIQGNDKSRLNRHRSRTGASDLAVPPSQTSRMLYFLSVWLVVAATVAWAEQFVEIWPADDGAMIKRWFEVPTYATSTDRLFGTATRLPTPLDQHLQDSYRGFIWFDLSAVPAGAAISGVHLQMALSDARPSAPCTRGIGIVDGVTRAQWNGRDANQRYSSLGELPFEIEQRFPSAAPDANYPYLTIDQRFVWRRPDVGVFFRVTSDETDLAAMSLFSFSDTYTIIEEASDQLEVKYALAPALTSPANNAVLDELDQIVLRWAQVLDIDSPLRYRVQYSTESNFTASATTEGWLPKETTQLGIGYIARGTRIYWRVRVEDAAGSGDSNYSDWSAARTFTTEGRYGALRVDILPASVAGALLENDRGQWQVDERNGWNDSGVTASALGSSSPHTIVFKSVPGWTTPPNQMVTITADQTTLVTGTYTLVPGTGGIKVDIQPDSLATAADVLNRAQYRIDNGPWQDDSAPAGVLATGFHTVSFKPLSGWVTPAPQTVNVPAGAVVDVTGVYAQYGTVSVTIDPPNVRNAPFSAAWRLDGGLWFPSGFSVQAPPGAHTISFRSAPGWTAPGIQSLVVNPGASHNVAGTYTLSIPVGQLTVHIDPPDVTTAATERARWSIAGTDVWFFSDETINIPAGDWTVEFSPVPGWKTPTPVIVTISPNNTLLLSRAYGVIAPRTISGFVRETGIGVSGAKIRFSNSVGEAETDDTGYYIINVPSGWTGRATPTAPDGSGLGYFEPAFRDFTNVVTSTIGQSFSFIPTGFGEMQGRYSGLALPEDGSVSSATTAAIHVNLRSTGYFTGKLRLAGKDSALRGQFDPTGSFSQTISRPGVSIEVSLQLVADPAVNRLTGTISLGSLVPAAITAPQLVYQPRSNPAPQAGRYTAAIQPLTIPAASAPRGFGLGAIKFTRGGRGTFTGRLGDGKPVSFSSPLSGTNQWPIYLYAHHGGLMIAGWGTVEDSLLPHPVFVPDIAASLDWVSVADSISFSQRTSLAGYRYVAPGTAERIIECADAEGNAIALTRDPWSDPQSEIQKTFTLTERNRSQFANDPHSRLKINTETGLFIGRLPDDVGTARPVFGAFLRSQDRACGLMKGAAHTKPLIIRPAD